MSSDEEKGSGPKVKPGDPKFDPVKRDALGRPRKWQGGFIRYRKNGDPVFVINQMIKGRHYNKALRVAGERDAMLEYLRFRNDPEAYVSDADRDEPLILDQALIKEYLAYCARPRQDNGSENSRKWMAYKEKALRWWAERLVDDRGRPLDLRKVRRVKHVLPHLEGTPGNMPGEWKSPPPRGRRHKREALKALYGWLRKHVGRLSAAEDPVMDMPVGKGTVAQTTGGKTKVVPREDVLAVADYLTGKDSRYGHALVVQAATGWHTTELIRFVGRGEIIQPVPRHLREPGVVAVLVGPKHKNGKRHFAKVGERAAFAAKILVCEKLSTGNDDPGEAGRPVPESRSSFSERWYYARVKAACRDLRIPVFSPAWMRHTNATYALEQGGFTASEVGKFLGHADGAMVASVYGPNAVPPKVPTVIDDEPKSNPPSGASGVEELARKIEDLERALLASARPGEESQPSRPAAKETEEHAPEGVNQTRHPGLTRASDSRLAGRAGCIGPPPDAAGAVVLTS